MVAGSSASDANVVAKGPAPAQTFVLLRASSLVHVAETLPNWVQQGSNGYLLVSTIGFEALAVEAIRELEKENAELRNRLDALEEMIGKR